MEKFLIQNSVICLACGEKLVSKHQHDYVVCSCDNGTFCDGGLSYQRFGGKIIDLIKQDNVYSDSPFEVIRKVLLRGSRGKDGSQPLTYIKLCDIDDEYLDTLIDYEELNRPQNRYLPFYKQEKEFRNAKTI